MFKNYVKIAIRNILKHKVYSIINILGLAVGISCFILLFLYILGESGYDSFYKNADQTYRVFVKQHITGIENNNSKTPGLLGPVLLQNLPETKSFTRIGYYGRYHFRYNENVFNADNIYAVDSSFFDVFTLSFIEGDSKTALNHPNTMVITQRIAKKYFGDDNPVGKILIVEEPYKADYLGREKGYTDKTKSFIITGVTTDFPENSHFSCDFLTSIYTYDINHYWLDLWYSTYVVLKKGTDPFEYDKKLQQIARNYVGPLAKDILGVSFDTFLKSGNVYTYKLQPITSIYLRSQSDYAIDLNSEWGNVKNNNIIYIYIFTVVAFFILAIAVINFMNLITARSEKRAKEVGIRKTLGSDRLKIILQFTGEAILMSFISVLIALILIEAFLPYFNSLVNRSLGLNLLGNFYSVPLIIVFIFIVGILAGSYPAVYLSSFKPVKALKTNNMHQGRKNIIRSGLVILQFSISIILLIGTLIIKSQLNFIQNKNLGFNKAYLFSINNADDLGPRLQAFKQELIRNAHILSISNSSQMFRSGIPASGYLYNKRQGTDPLACQFVDADDDFLKTYQIKLQQGRFFSRDFLTDSSAVLINEAAVKVFGDKEPVGKELTRIGKKNWEKTFTIIGVIKNFNFESLHQKIRPLILHYSPPAFASNILTIRLASDDMKKTIEFIRKTWKNFAGENEMYWRFVDEKIARLYESEEKINTMATLFSFLAIFIACLGLFGLAAYVAEQRTKEIGIRKVVGASVSKIIMLLVKDFTKWVLVANLVAWPVAWYFMNQWLQNFAYRINISWWIFVLAGGMALLIALLTVSGQAIRTALTNPVNTLRYE